MSEKQQSKILILLLIITSLLGYLEWSGGNHSFLFQVEAEVILRLFTEPTAVLHPFTILPLFGQLILLISLFQQTPNKIMVYLGMGSLGVLLIFMFLIGLLGLNYKILFSVVPFIIISVITIVYYRHIYLRRA